MEDGSSSLISRLEDITSSLPVMRHTKGLETPTDFLDWRIQRHCEWGHGMEQPKA